MEEILKLLKMIQIRATKSLPNGIADVFFRFIGKYIFIKKKSNNPYSVNLINEFKKKNLKIWESREWLKLDLFGDNTLVKLGNIEIDLEKESVEDIEIKLSNFYIEKYKQGGFIVETKNGIIE
jgi:hypothetical protein